MEVKEPRLWRRLLKGSLLAFTALVLTLLALEIGLRIFAEHPFGPEGELAGMYVNDGESSYRLSPGWRGEQTVDERTVSIRVNSLGMRGPEIEPRGPGQLRVLCLGDSFVFGYGVEDEETFASLLPGELSSAVGRRVITGNAGVAGHGTVDMVRMFEHHRDAFDPDFVVASIYLGNDFQDDFVLTKLIVRGNYLGGTVIPGPWARVLQTTWRGRLALSSHLAMRVEQMLLGSSWGLDAEPTVEEVTAFSGFPPPEQRHAGLFMDAVDEEYFRDEITGWFGIPRILTGVEQSLREIQRLAGETPVVVLIFPTSFHVDNELWSIQLTKLGFDPIDFRFGLVQERLKAICTRLGLPCLDFTETARELADPQSVFLTKNKHLNPRGHRLVARRLAERIQDMQGR